MGSGELQSVMSSYGGIDGKVLVFSFFSCEGM